MHMSLIIDIKFIIHIIISADFSHVSELFCTYLFDFSVFDCLKCFISAGSHSDWSYEGDTGKTYLCFFKCMC